MRLSQLKGLILIHKYGSISKAAQESYQSQSALSVAIKDLEEELGNTILIRSKKGVSFTPYGLQVLEHINNIFAEINLIRELDGNSRGIHGNIALGTGSYLSNLLATELWLSAKEQLPGIHLKIHQDNNANIITDILLGRLDLGLLQIGAIDGTMHMPQELVKSHLTFHPLFTRPMIFAVGARHPLLKKQNIKLSDLFPYSYITNKDIEEDATYQYLKAHGYRHECIQVNDGMQRSLVSQINGFQTLVDIGLTLGNDRYQEKLCPLHINNFPATYTIGWIHKSQTLSNAEEAILHLLNTQIQQYIY